MQRFKADELALVNQDPTDGRVEIEFKNASGAEAAVLLSMEVAEALREAFRIMPPPPATAGKKSPGYPQSVSIESLIDVQAGEGLLGLLVRQKESPNPILIRFPEPVFERVLVAMAKLGQLAAHKGTRQ